MLRALAMGAALTALLLTIGAWLFAIALPWPSWITLLFASVALAAIGVTVMVFIYLLPDPTRDALFNSIRRWMLILLILLLILVGIIQVNFDLTNIPSKICNTGSVIQSLIKGEMPTLCSAEGMEFLSPTQTPIPTGNAPLR